jgi:D-alanyl-lipoteichoic acid acyltransferase DltB (MBOAT superfamily)
MVFNSLEFLCFLIAVYTAYRFLPFRGQNILLLVASYIFYGWWDERFLFLILLTTSVDFSCGLMIHEGRLSRSERLIPALCLVAASFFFVTVNWKAIDLFHGSIEWANVLPSTWTGWLVFAGTCLGIIGVNLLYPKLKTVPAERRRTLLLIASIVTNLGILCVFKYFNFFAGSAQALLNSIGLPAHFLTLNVLLPIGISFYTFETMSYTIDVYKGKMQPTHHFWDFALFLCFFPRLVAGPIVRAEEFIPQVTQPRTLSFDQTIRGLYLILFGLFKKVAIADGLAGSVNAVYNATGSVSWIDVVAATLLFTFQIYCDFSGYSDIARGVAKLFGIELMLNFNLPYFSKTPSEFWQRWHISLSSWLRDYLYIPLGGNRKGNSRTYQNLMTTMVLGGLWHGAAWNYVFWGIYQGGLLCIYRLLGIGTSRKQAEKNHFGLVSSIGLTLVFFGLTCYGWLLFRANSWEQIVEFSKILITDIGNLSLSMPKPTLPALLGLPLLVLYEFVEYQANTAHFYYRYSAVLRGVLYAMLTLLIVMGTSNAPAQFIYFQF